MRQKEYQALKELIESLSNEMQLKKAAKLVAIHEDGTFAYGLEKTLDETRQKIHSAKRRKFSNKR